MKYYSLDMFGYSLDSSEHSFGGKGWEGDRMGAAFHILYSLGT